MIGKLIISHGINTVIKHTALVPTVDLHVNDHNTITFAPALGAQLPLAGNNINNRVEVFNACISGFDILAEITETILDSGVFYTLGTGEGVVATVVDSGVWDIKRI